MDPAPLAISPDLSRSINALGVDVYRQVAHDAGNLAVSPMSIALALGMTYGGARGETAAEMARTLHLAPDADAVHAANERLVRSFASPRPVELRVANRLFGAQGLAFAREFIDLTRERYGAPLEPTDFRGDAEAARSRINGWVESQTNNRIQDLLPGGSITPGTSLVLVNAIYFYGHWVHRFQEDMTRPETFHLSGGEAVQVPTMHQTEDLSFGRDAGVTLLQMPYLGDDLAMTVVLPEARDGLAALEASLTADQIERWLSTPHEQEVVVALPRFIIDPDESLTLSQVLQSLGMQLAFTSGAADFSGIAVPPTPAESLYISEVYHQAFVEVNEEGTEAAAATAVAMAPGGPPTPTQRAEFRADHPFLFLIHTRASRAVLFMGRVVDPR